MRVSTRGRYALRLMLDLAMNNTGEPVRLKDVAKRQEISEKYLEQIISILNKAGFVKSVRGPAGGCVEDGTDCGRADQCVTVLLWKKLNDAINGVVDNITLADLVDWQMQKANEYVI